MRHSKSNSHNDFYRLYKKYKRKYRLATDTHAIYSNHRNTQSNQTPTTPTTPTTTTPPTPPTSPKGRLPNSVVGGHNPLMIDWDYRNAAVLQTIREAFQDYNNETRVIFITMAGGDAINLQSAKALVFYDSPWSAGDYLQIIGRMIRIGSENDTCYAVHLVCRDTIDERVGQVVRKKMKLIEQVLGERVKGQDDEVIGAGSDIKDLFEAMVVDARKTR